MAVRLVLGIVILAVFVGGLFVQWRTEVKAEVHKFNDGRCLHCGRPLELFDKDGVFGDGWICSHCKYVVRIKNKKIVYKKRKDK